MRAGLMALLFLTLAASGFTQSTNDAPSSPFEKQCHGIAMRIERDIAAGDAAFLDRYFDINACLDRAFAGLNAPSDLEARIRRDICEKFNERTGKPLLNATAIRYLRLRRAGSEPRFLFRQVPKEGGVYYFELIFERTRRQDIKVVDMYIYSLGETHSQCLRQTILPFCHKAERGWLDTLSKKDAEFINHLTDINKMTALSARGRNAESIAIYSKLPESIQKEKMLLLHQMYCANQIDPRATQAAIDLWRKTYPGESSVDLVAANLHLARRNFDQAFAALDRFDKAIGGDAFLDVLRGQHCKNQGKYDQVRVWGRKAVDRDPNLREAWELLISACLSARNYTELAQVLTEWEQRTKADVVRLAESEKLADFARSEPGRQWLAQRDGKRTLETKPAASNTPKGEYKLQGIFFNASNPSAVISGRTVFTGDRVSGGYRVEKISQRAVTLKSPEGELLELAVK